MLATTIQFPSINHNPIERARQRSSNAKQAFRKLRQDAKELAPLIWEEGMDLLKKIHNECAETLAKIWDAPDADDFVKETSVPKTNLAELDKEIGLTNGGKNSDNHDSQEARMKAKRELRELASGAKI